MAGKSNKPEARIARMFQQRCSGLQVSIMDIPRIFNAGHAAIKQGATDEQLGDAIAAFVASLPK
jgi:hypothetical protein